MAQLIQQAAVPQNEVRGTTRLRYKGAIWERLAPYAFIAPFFIAFIVFQLFPIGFSFFLSVHEWNPYAPKDVNPFTFVKFDNFDTLFHTDRFWHSLQVTLIITLFCTVIGTALAVILAVLIDKLPEWLAQLLRVAFFMPSVTSIVVITYIWKQLLNTRYGFVNEILVKLGSEPQNFLGEYKYALASLIVMLIWAGLGWDALIVTSALRNIPQELYEAARLDGAGGIQEFWYITIPLLRPVLLFVVTTGLIFLLGLFAQVQLLTNGNPVHRTETTALYLYNRAFGQQGGQDFGVASAVAVVLTFIMFTASYLNFRFFGSHAEY